MSIRRTVLALISLGIVVVTARLIPLARTPRKSEPLITISAATTRITEPLRTDGYVDYFAALNQHLSQGVTPENNSAVPMIQAMGPGVLPEEIRQPYFQMLGIPPLPDEGPYFVSFLEYGKRVRDPEASELSDEDRWKAYDELERAMTQPWSAAELPTVAAWLEANEQPLARIIEASNRPRRYDPLLPAGGLSGRARSLPERTERSRS